jgi:hypothetical protein
LEVEADLEDGKILACALCSHPEFTYTDTARNGGRNQADHRESDLCHCSDFGSATGSRGLLQIYTSDVEYVRTLL